MVVLAVLLASSSSSSTRRLGGAGTVVAPSRDQGRRAGVLLRARAVARLRPHHVSVAAARRGLGLWLRAAGRGASGLGARGLGHCDLRRASSDRTRLRLINESRPAPSGFER
eukprot:scaffold45674_cov47-Phaeocystis_antarctica.AAC.1